MGGLEPVLRIEAELGECPRWSAREGVLYWADILGRRLNRFDPRTGENIFRDFDEEIGCFAEREEGGFIAGLRSGLWFLRGDGTKERMVARPETDPAAARFNDGRADPWGGFWAGTQWEGEGPAAAGLYRLTRERALLQIEGGLAISNGLAFAPDGRRAYHSDTEARTIWRYPLDADTGAVLGPREVFRAMGGEMPDGASVDAEGCYWVALYGSGRVARLSPAGDEIGSWPLPALCPTMPAFGGPDLRTLYVTTAREDRSEAELRQYPLSGSLFAMAVDVPGLPEPRFAG